MEGATVRWVERALAAILPLVGACSLVTSLDGLSGGGAPDAATADAGLAMDSAVTAPARDAGRSLDATGGFTADSGGASPPPDAGGGAALAYCASLSPKPIFCDDFDEGPLADPAIWDRFTGTGATATLAKDGEDVSPPAAMLVEVSSASPAKVDCAGYKNFPSKQGAAGTYTLVFALRVDQPDTTTSSDAILAAIQLWNGRASWDLQFEVSYDQATGDIALNLSENDTPADGGAPIYTRHDVATHLAAGAWTPVAMAVDVASGGGSTATLSLNGQEVESTPVTISTPDPIPEILVGATYARGSPVGWQVRYDNVAFGAP